MRIVIIGNGVAGIEAALSVRRLHSSWDITIVSEESEHFFSRTALMWVLSGQLSHRCIEPYERDLYARNAFSRVRARVLGIDVEKSALRLAGGHSPLAYDRLLIACGSRARSFAWPKSELAGIGTFVSLQDLEWLEHEIHGGPGYGQRPPRADAHAGASAEGSPYSSRVSARELKGGSPPRSPAVIGGGLIGIEVVEAMLCAGLRPRFFLRDDSFWPMALDARESAWIADRLRDHGVDVHLHESVQAFEGDGFVSSIRTDRGAHACDLAVVAIGVVPNTEWLEGSAIERDSRGGIVVDAALETSAPNVFAAGDCASVRWADGSVRPEQLWYTARDQGRIAGLRLAGESATYERGTAYNSAKLMDIEYTTVGRVDTGEDFFFEERGAVRSTTRITLEDGRIVGVNLLGRRWDHRVLIRFIEERRSLAWALDHLHEASFDTELVPPLRIPSSARGSLEEAG